MADHVLAWDVALCLVWAYLVFGAGQHFLKHGCDVSIKKKKKMKVHERIQLRKEIMKFQWGFMGRPRKTKGLRDLCSMN